MKRLMAITMLIIVSVLSFGQQTLTKECIFYKGKSTIKCKFGYSNDNFFILVGEFTKRGASSQINDKFVIRTKEKDIPFVVTEREYGQMDKDGFLSFPIEKNVVEDISKGVKNILLYKRDEEVKKFREYGSYIKGSAKSILRKMDTQKEAQELGTRVYPSWRD